MYQDPSMKDIVDDFCREGKKQIDALNDLLENLEDDLSDKKQLEEFGQVIDRMMGAAKSLEIQSVAIFCELGKNIGYKASQINQEALISVVVAVLIDAVQILEKLILKLEKGEDLELKEISATAFLTRLQWLNDKFKHIKRSSVAIEGSNSDYETSNVSNVEDKQDLIDDILKQFKK